MPNDIVLFACVFLCKIIGNMGAGAEDMNKVN